MKRSRFWTLALGLSLALLSGCKKTSGGNATEESNRSPGPQPPTMALALAQNAVVAGTMVAVVLKVVDKRGHEIALDQAKSFTFSSDEPFELRTSPQLDAPSLSVLTLPKDTSQRTLYLRATKSGARSLRVQAEEDTAAITVDVLPAAPSALSVSGKPVIGASQCETYVVSAFDAFGNAAPVAASTVLSTSGVGDFYPSSACAEGSKLTNPTVVLPAGQSTASFFVKKTQAQPLDLIVDDTPNSGMAAAMKSVTVTPGPVARMKVIAANEVKQQTCLPVRIEAVDSAGNQATIAQTTQVEVTFKSISPGSLAVFFTTPDCTGAQSGGLTGTFVAGTKYADFSMATQGPGGTAVLKVTDSAALLAPSELSVSILSDCGPDRVVNYNAWTTSLDANTGVLTVQGNNNLGYLGAGYLTNGSLYLVETSLADDPLAASLVRINCVQELVVRSGNGKKTIDLSTLGFVTGVPSTLRLNGKITVIGQGTAGITVIGSLFDDIINGTNGNDRLIGGPGNDIIRTFGGRDVVYGGSGDDQIFSQDNPGFPILDLTIYGGTGADSITIQSSGSLNLTGPIDTDGPNMP